MSIRLVVADDHPIVLGGLVQIFATEPDLMIVASASNGDEALAAVRRFCPDILVLDLRMPGKNGLTVLRELKEERSSTRVVVLTAENNDDAVEAVLLGAHGTVLKSLPVHLLIKCIREVHAGKQWLEKGIAARVIDSFRTNAAEQKSNAGLTARQWQIARLVVEGLPSKSIARKLSIKEGTAKLHLHHIYERLGITGRMALVRYMRERHGI